MALYKFEIIEGDSADTLEIECADLEGLRAEALNLAADRIKHLKNKNFWEHPRWALRVTDDSNISILSLTFSGDPTVPRGE
jgi:Domain of unknown function (DUF6894)